MVKILSQAGSSLADTYNVEGSIAGIDQLETRELPIVHEMGGTIFAERLSGGMDRRTTGAIAQNTDWDIILTGLGRFPSRILGIFVFSDDASRLSHATVSVRDPLDEREVPIFAWDTGEAVVTVRIQDDGAAVANEVALNNVLNVAAATPSLLIGTDQPAPIDQMAFRGRTSGFGAGTVVVTMLMYKAFSEIGGISSRGLPLPSW